MCRRLRPVCRGECRGRDEGTTEYTQKGRNCCSHNPILHMPTCHTHTHTHTHRTLSFSRSLARSLWLPRSQTPVIFRAKYQPYVRLGYLLRYTMTALHFASLLHGLNQSAWHCGAEDEEGTRIVHVRQSTKQTYVK